MEKKSKHSIVVIGGGENAPTMIRIDGRTYRCTIQRVHEHLAAGEGDKFFLDLTMKGVEVDA